jgi:hypothetical protein
MASGKTLELAQITKPQPDKLCVAPGCGKLWSEHLKKKPNKFGYRERLKKYEGEEHRVNATMVLDKPKPTKAERRQYKKSLKNR